MTHRIPPTAGAAAIMLLAVLLLGCAPETPSEPSPTTAPSESSPPTDPEQPLDDAEIVTPPEAEEQSQNDAIAAATTVMTTFAQPELSAEAWWNAMLPLLSQQGAYAHEGTDPALIPVSAVTGPGEILEGSTEVSLIVRIPTDAGLYNITMTRPDSSSPWLAERIRPAEG